MVYKGIKTILRRKMPGRIRNRLTLQKNRLVNIKTNRGYPKWNTKRKRLEKKMNRASVNCETTSSSQIYM